MEKERERREKLPRTHPIIVLGGGSSADGNDKWQWAIKAAPKKTRLYIGV